MGKSKYLDLRVSVYRIACLNLFIPTVASPRRILARLSNHLYGAMNTQSRFGAELACKSAETGMFTSRVCSFARALACSMPMSPRRTPAQKS
jgi:hypothetical protein